MISTIVHDLKEGRVSFMRDQADDAWFDLEFAPPESSDTTHSARIYKASMGKLCPLLKGAPELINVMVENEPELTVRPTIVRAMFSMTIGVYKYPMCIIMLKVAASGDLGQISTTPRRDVRNPTPAAGAHRKSAGKQPCWSDRRLGAYESRRYPRTIDICGYRFNAYDVAEMYDTPYRRDMKF